MIQILCVAPDHILDIWPHVRPFIASAFAHDRGDDDADVVLDDLIGGGSLLWIAWDGQAIIAAVTTKLIATTRGTVCRITTCGGRDLKRWRHGLEQIEAYARAEGCRAVRFEVRKGFARLFADYRQPWIVLEKRLD